MRLGQLQAIQKVQLYSHQDTKGVKDTKEIRLVAMARRRVVGAAVVAAMCFGSRA